MVKVDEVEFTNNDVYYMEVLESLIVINNNYEGILVLDTELRQIKEINIIEGLTIYDSFKKGNELLLYCPDNNCFVYVNVDLNQKKVISLKGFEDWRFSKLYEWNQEYIILSNYNGRFAKVDLEKEGLIEVYSNEEECDSIQKKYYKLQQYTMLKMNVAENKAFIRMSDSKIALIKYEEHVTVIEEFEREQYHDFESINGYIVKIGEDIVEVTYKNNFKVNYFSKHFAYLRGKMIIKDKGVFLFLLSGNKSDSNNVMIERYKY